MRSFPFMQISSCKTDPTWTAPHMRKCVKNNKRRPNSMRLNLHLFFILNDKLVDNDSMVFAAHPESGWFMLNRVSRLETKQSAVGNKNANSVRGERHLIWDRCVMVIFDRMSFGFWILASSWKSKLCAGRLRRQTEIEANISDAMWMSSEKFPSIVSRRRRRRWWFEFSPVQITWTPRVVRQCRLNYNLCSNEFRWNVPQYTSRSIG